MAHDALPVVVVVPVQVWVPFKVKVTGSPAKPAAEIAFVKVAETVVAPA
jgi:Ni,Fe-hydrogenase III small subunit